MGKMPRIVSFYIFLTDPNNLIPDNVTGLKILKRKCAFGSSFIIWKLLSLKMSTTLRVGSSSSMQGTVFTFARLIGPTIKNLYNIQGSVLIN